MHHIGALIHEAAQVPGRDLVICVVFLVVLPHPLIAGMQQPPRLLGVVGLVEDDLVGKPQVVDAQQESHDGKPHRGEPSGPPVPQLTVLKSLDSSHHAHSLDEWRQGAGQAVGWLSGGCRAYWEFG